jgi:glycosyltransferase involved in cell wall biosynthesis
MHKKRLIFGGSSMKIVHTCNRYYPYFGGLESHVQNISEKMVQLGHQVSVYSTDPTGLLPPSEVLNGVNVRRFKCFAPKDSYFFSTKLYDSLKVTDCDIIHGHDLNGFPLLAGALAKRSKKFFVSLHVGAFSSYFRNLARFPYDRILMHVFLRRASRIICVSEGERKIYQKGLRMPKDKFIVIPNGYEPNASLVKNPLKKERSILSVGRLEKAKGLHYLLSSFDFIEKDSEFNDVQLTIVGKGPYEAKLRQLISKLGITKKVFMHQNVPSIQLAELYLRCTVFVALSNYESQGLAVCDALALQKPTITSTAPVLDDYVKKGYSIGVSLPPNIEELTEKIKNVLRNPIKYRPPKIEMPSWTEVTNRTLTLYNDALDE